jgi:hypothetical protein
VYVKIFKLELDRMLLVSMSEQSVFKRIAGSAHVQMRTGEGTLMVQITLDGTPPWEWIECFGHPQEYKYNEAHPNLATVAGDAIIFESAESCLEENIALMDDYIRQANESYAKKLAQQKEERSQLEQDQEELSKINERLKSL